jgi:formylglycine-generating enzyme required for sulfatase activity
VSQFQAFDPDYKPSYDYFMDPNMPATAVTFLKARAYCRDRGKRLPTSEEWQLACRGLQGTEYAYGNSFDPTKARSGRRIWTDGPKAVGAFEPNALGLFDMSGNVWEWVDDGEAEGAPRSVYGGSWVDGPRLTRCGSRRQAAPDVAAVNYGFRCARSLTEGDRQRMAREEAERSRKQQAAAAREARRVREKLEAQAAARRAKVEARAEKLLQARQAEERAKMEQKRAKAAAFAQRVSDMVAVGDGPADTFYVDPGEVTVARYRAYDPTYRPDEFSSEDDMPATGLTYEEAAAYCKSLGKRLPTRGEWVSACLGSAGNLYAYGGTYDATRANTGRPWHAGAVASGSGEANEYGLRNTVGNVWEWVDDHYDGAEELRSVMGGSWVNGPDRAKCTGESWARPEARRANVGFRCVARAQ